jgi:hypothetical protein
VTGPNKIVNKFCSEINEGRKEVWTDGQTDKRKYGQIDKQTEGSLYIWTNRQKGSTDRWTPVLSFFGSLAFSIKK